jgi:hypothetical protein
MGGGTVFYVRCGGCYGNAEELIYCFCMRFESTFLLYFNCMTNLLSYLCLNIVVKIFHWITYILLFICFNTVMERNLWIFILSSMPPLNVETYICLFFLISHHIIKI